MFGSFAKKKQQQQQQQMEFNILHNNKTKNELDQA